MKRGYFRLIFQLLLITSLILQSPFSSFTRVQAKSESQVAGEFDCVNVSEIPQLECEALVSLYISTSGASWSNHTNWLESDTPSNWFGVTVSGGNVTEISLNSNQLIGSIPSDLGGLTYLQTLNLEFNQISGSIPPELGSLTNLLTLNLFYNQLSGAIPPELGGLTDLQNLNLSSNQFGGAIPPELANLTNLWHLYIYSTQLSGEIPPVLGSMTNLQAINLSNNHLGGAIPPELGGLVNLETLDLAGNQFSGAIPPELGNLTSLRELMLGSNQLSGPVPPELGGLTNLERLYLFSRQLSGSIPLTFTLLTKLYIFHFVETRLCEPQDPAFQTWKAAIPYWYSTGLCYSINGEVTQADSSPLPGVTIAINNTQSELSGLDGSYTLVDLPPRHLYLDAHTGRHGLCPLFAQCHHQCRRSDRAGFSRNGSFHQLRQPDRDPRSGVRRSGRAV
jgi:hypothetical protein